ncbi:MAG: hypothetical protein HY721_03350 [Planctomycetes bacterium]|nr:hypothetical protein [Planctomycetota bacterium]
MDPRRVAATVLRRFVRGEATAAELQRAARRLDLDGPGPLCEALELSRSELEEIAVGFEDLEREISGYLEGRLGREAFFARAVSLHRIVTSWAYEAAGVSSPAVGTTLRLLALLLEASHPAPLAKLRRSLLRIRRWLAAREEVPLRGFLPRIFRDMGALRLCILENPLESSMPFLYAGAGSQWIDIGLMNQAGEEVRLIPMSIFTRRFFHHEMPELMSRITEQGEPVRRDDFCYHPENDQAISLKERFPQLRDSPAAFQYFIDCGGLAEIVIDVPFLRRPQVLFAARLFCLQNRIRSATLDGRRVSFTALTH